MPGFMPGLHVFSLIKVFQDVDGRDKRAFIPILDGLCAVMTDQSILPPMQDT
ncbi:hypothetical protein AFEL58S_02619 [Afipia felis]